MWTKWYKLKEIHRGNVSKIFQQRRRFEQIFNGSESRKDKLFFFFKHFFIIAVTEPIDKHVTA